MIQYQVKCPHCNRISLTSKEFFQCRQPSGCGKRSRTSYFSMSKYEIDHDIDMDQPVQVDVQTIDGKLVH